MADDKTAATAAAIDKGEAVRGVGELRLKGPRAKKLKNTVLLVVLLVVVGLVFFITFNAKRRRQHQIEQTSVIKAGKGSAEQQAKSLYDEAARKGENVGSSHIPTSFSPKEPGQERRSLLDGGTVKNTSAVPPLRYNPNAGAAATEPSNQAQRSLTPEEVELEKEYELEQQALRATMVANTSSVQSTTAAQPVDPVQAQNDLLLNRLQQMGKDNPDAIGRLADALLNNRTASGSQALGLKTLPASITDYEAQNSQGEKEAFGARVLSKKDADYQMETRVPAMGPYEVKAGWLIPAVLEGELDSDLPGTVRAHVRENVYDSTTGKYLLIPQGSKLIGEYNSHVGYGQKTLQAVFTRVIFPDGSSLDLESDSGVAGLGSAGLHDKVDEHWKRLLGGALLTSLFAAGIQVSQGQNSSVLQTQSVGQQVGAAVGQEIGQVGAEVTRRNLNIQPTLRIRPGYRFFVSVAKDLSFPAPYAAMRTVAETAK